MSNGHGLSPAQLFDLIDQADFSSEKERVDAKLDVFRKYTLWSSEHYSQYEELLKRLKSVKRKTNASTSEIGDALENLVTFIFEKSYFYKVYPNKRTGTNEIDQFVVLSEKGKQAIADYKFSPELLGVSDGYFLCECKNYKETVGSTWVGKFYTLLKVSGDCKLGIIFSCEGLTGSEHTWYDAHGLTKVIYRMSEDNNKTYILDFNMADFDSLLDRKNTIFKIINRKKEALTSCIKSMKLYEDDCEGAEEIQNIYHEIQNI
jgi:hypothetical protein